jgi:hypothetical protein
VRAKLALQPSVAAIYRLIILTCKGCIAVLAEISDRAVPVPGMSPDLMQSMHKAIHALNDVIAEAEK